MENEVFDIAVLGAGCASFQLLHQMSLQPDWQKKTVALLSDNANLQRSWCFWSKEVHPLQHLVKKSWSKINFTGNGFSKTENIAPYKYHYIPGEDFFNYFKKIFLPQNKNIIQLTGIVENVSKNKKYFFIESNHLKFQSENVFSSLPPLAEFDKAKIKLKQHFKGWFIKTENSAFDDNTMTMMDFSIPQINDTRFVYILPFSSREALIEMTVFSPDIYDDVIYENALNVYMTKHFTRVKFTILNTEKGAIPMTDALFSRLGTSGEVLIGTAAGMVKATTGYAFKRIGRDCKQLAEDMAHKKPLRWTATQGRFRFYDRLLLGIIADEPIKGSVIFEALFKKLPMINIFRFLDEETYLWEELYLFTKLPFAPFLKQVYKQWTH